MRSLSSLIRLHRWQLDEKRRNLVQLERLQTELLQQSERLEQEIAAEQTAAGSGETGFAYSAYALAAVRRRATLARSIDDLAPQIETMREAVAAAFAEVKKYENLKAQREQRVRRGVERRQQIEQDEIGLQGFRGRRRD